MIVVEFNTRLESFQEEEANVKRGPYAMQPSASIWKALSDPSIYIYIRAWADIDMYSALDVLDPMVEWVINTRP